MNQKLYLYPNGTKLDDTTQLVASTLITVISLQGNRDAPVTDLTITGLTFSSTRPTFMQQYSIVSAGDWAVYRGGAVTASNTVGLVVELCTFSSIGGNGVLLDGRNTRASLRFNEFVDVGDSAMVAVGETAGIDGYSEPRSSNFTSVIGNFVHEIGLIGKQVSSWCQMLAVNSLIERNVMLNQPRAAVSFNDGLGGGNVVRFNLAVNACRETADHGPLNSWDRMPYIFPGPDGLPTMTPAWSNIYGNFFVHNGGMGYPIDHDDGSAFWRDEHNVLVYGGAKNFLGHDKTASKNLYIFPDVKPSANTCVGDYGAQWPNAGYNESYCNNTCLIYNASGGSSRLWAGVGALNAFAGCSSSSLSRTVMHTANNTYYVHSPVGGAPSIDCDSQLVNFTEWQQALGQERGSVVRDHLPSPSQVVAMARDVLADASLLPERGRVHLS